MPAPEPPKRYQIGAPAFHPERIGEGWRPPSSFKKSNVLKRYCHQRKKRDIDPHYQKYYQGRQSSDVTEILKPNLPGSPFKEAVYFPHKATDVTALLERAGKLPKRPASAPDNFHGVKASDVTEATRIIPPSHAGKGERQPYFGVRSSPVTDPKKFVDTSGLPFLSWWSQPHSKGLITMRPQTAPTVVYPQHVSPELLQKMILDRKPYSRRDNSAIVAAPDRLSEVPSSARSVPGSVASAAGSARSPKSDKAEVKSTSQKSEATSTKGLEKAPGGSHGSVRSEKSVKAPSKAASKSSGVSISEEKPPPGAPKPPRDIRKSLLHKKPERERSSLAGLPSLTAETLEKLGLEKLDRVTKWAGELQTWAIPEKPVPKPVYQEKDHSRKKTDVTSGYIW